MQQEMALHCYSWAAGSFDFKKYLECSSVRFYQAYHLFSADREVRRICDIGGFWVVFPITLKVLGYDVTMTESLGYYGDTFKGLFQYIASRGVRIVDYDPFAECATPPITADIVTVMAVLEHYPHSLQTFMGNVSQIMAPTGKIYLEVPNIAFWPKRVRFLMGETSNTPLKDIFKSKVPFIGHHHEFTISELRDLAELSGLSILKESFYNYSPGSFPSLKMALKNPLQFLAFTSRRNTRECLAMLCKLKPSVTQA